MKVIVKVELRSVLHDGEIDIDVLENAKNTYFEEEKEGLVEQLKDLGIDEVEILSFELKED